MTMTSLTTAALVSALGATPHVAALTTPPIIHQFRVPDVLNAEVHATGIGWVDKQHSALLALESDWDGYGAERIAPSQINAMAVLLGSILPKGIVEGSIVPASDGSLQVEWHLGGGSFGLHLSAPGHYTVWYRPVGQDIEIERSGFGGASLLKALALQSVA